MSPAELRIPWRDVTATRHTDTGVHPIVGPALAVALHLLHFCGAPAGVRFYGGGRELGPDDIDWRWHRRLAAEWVRP